MSKGLIGSDLQLVERLRKMKGVGDYQLAALMDGVGPMAADEIERLQAQAVPVGYKLVPIEPTPLMVMRGAGAAGNRNINDVWRAMLDAAPDMPDNDQHNRQP